MQTHGPSNNITPIHAIRGRIASVSDDLLVKEIESLRQTPTQAIHIHLNAASIEGTMASCVCKEIQLWSELIGSHPLKFIQFSHPFRHLGASDITKLLHILVSSFNTPSADDQVRRTLCSPDDINPERVALLKGLGFQQFQILCDGSPNSLNSVEDAIACLRQFAISIIGIQFKSSEPLHQLRDLTRHLQERFAPHFVYLGNRDGIVLTCEEDLQPPSGLIFDHDLFNSKFCLSFGPDGLCRVGNLRLQNFGDLGRYREALAKHQLPINKGSR